MGKVMRAVQLRPYRCEDRQGNPLVVAEELELLKEVIFTLQRESQGILEREGEFITWHLEHGDPETGKPYPRQATAAGKQMGIPVNPLPELKSHAMIEYMVWTQVIAGCRAWATRQKIVAQEEGRWISPGAKRTVTAGAPKAGPEFFLSATNSNYATLTASGGDLCLDVYVKDHRVKFYFHLPPRYQRGSVSKPRVFVDHRGRVRFSFSIKQERPLPLLSDTFVIGIDVGMRHPMAWAVIRAEGGQVVEEGILPYALRRLKASCDATQAEVKGLHRKLEDTRDPGEQALLRQELSLQRQALSRKRKALAQEAGVFTADLSARYGNAVVILEDLGHISNTMTLGRWNRGALKSAIENSLEAQGGLSFTVNCAYTSQNCNACLGFRTMTFSGREGVCRACGVMHDRDLNAAANVALRGISKALKASKTRAARPDSTRVLPKPRPPKRRRRQLPKAVARDRQKLRPTPRRPSVKPKPLFSPERKVEPSHGTLGPSKPPVLAGDPKDGRRTAKRSDRHTIWSP